MPSNWLPSRRVVSKMSTREGAPGGGTGAASLREELGSDCMLDPVLVAVDLAADSTSVLLADGLRHRAGRRDGAVVDLVDRRDLRRGAADEHLLGDVEVAARDVAERDVEAEIARDRHHRALRDA